MSIAPHPVDRWLITADLVTLAPLSIRTGAEELRRPAGKEPPPGRPREEKQGDSNDATINAIELDVKGRPFVPGSALKGLLRSLAAGHLSDDAEASVETLFGGMVRPGRTGTDAQLARGGAAEFRNAYVRDDLDYAPPVRGRTAIDRGSRTAAAHMLRHDRAVPPNTSFALEILVDRADVSAVSLLRSLLALVDGTGTHSSLGSGDGRVRIDPASIRVNHWDASHIRAWLASTQSNWRKARCEDATAATNAPPPTARGKVARFDIALQIEGHFLVSTAVESEEVGAPNHVPYQSHPGEPLRTDRLALPELPASSFDGALRAQAERIWRTVHGNPPEDWSVDPPPGPLEELFGSRNRKGMLTPSAFTGAAAKPVRVDFVAIDRLSGGSSGSAKFAVLAFEAPLLEGSIELRFDLVVSQRLTGQPEGSGSRTLSAAAIGLLALTMRDLAEGDVVLGYGTRKGFGGVASLHHATAGLTALLNAIAVAWQGADCDPRGVIDGAVSAFRDWQPATTRNDIPGQQGQAA